jgi:hypothetical protein
MASKPPYTRKLVPPGYNETAAASRDEQILDLLNSLGQRLIASERERASLKQSLERLESRQSDIENAQEEYAEKIDRAVAMTDKIEEAIAAQSRTNRRIEKMHQERVQMLRKLERIEETVIETSEALNAKALVLLTDQKTADKSGQPRLSAETALAPTPAANDMRPFWQSPAVIRTAATGVVIMLGALCGWAIYNFMPQGQPAEQIAVIERENVDNSIAPPPVEEIAAATDEIVEEPEVPQPAPVAESAPAALDVLKADDAELEAAFDEDTAKLAAALNDLEPGVAAQQAPEEIETPEPAPAPEPVAAIPEQTIPATPDALRKEAEKAEDFVATVKSETPPLAQRLKPDTSLPPVVAEIEKRAFAGNAEAQHDLAAIYTAGHGGVKADYARAASWFTEAAVQGVANARYNLGVLYHQGLGVPKDLEKAIGWYTAAAALKHPEAQYNLGIAHIEGIGTKYNPAAAAAYFQSAAKGGILEAAYNLGLIHENGLLGKIEQDKALYWYKQAADRGSPEAAAAMAQLIKSIGIKDTEIDSYIAKVVASLAAAMPPPPARGPVESAPAKTAPAAEKPVQKSAVESLRPEDKVDIGEVASYIPAVDEAELAHPETRTPAASKPAKDNALIAQVQEQLMRLGLYPGPADGRIGPQTEDAIRSYQSASNIAVDGRATEALLLHLVATETNATAAPNDEYGSRE